MYFWFWHKVSSSQSTTKQAFSIGGIYHVTVRFSLEPDRHFLGGLWRFYEKAVGAACRDVRFNFFELSLSTRSGRSRFQKAVSRVATINIDSTRQIMSFTATKYNFTPKSDFRSFYKFFIFALSIFTLSLLSTPYYSAP